MAFDDKLSQWRHRAKPTVQSSNAQQVSITPETGRQSINSIVNVMRKESRNSIAN